MDGVPPLHVDLQDRSMALDAFAFDPQDPLPKVACLPSGNRLPMPRCNSSPSALPSCQDSPLESSPVDRCSAAAAARSPQSTSCRASPTALASGIDEGKAVATTGAIPAPPHTQPPPPPPQQQQGGADTTTTTTTTTAANTTAAGAAATPEVSNRAGAGGSRNAVSTGGRRGGKRSERKLKEKKRPARQEATVLRRGKKVQRKTAQGTLEGVQKAVLQDSTQSDVVVHAVGKVIGNDGKGAVAKDSLIQSLMQNVVMLQANVNSLEKRLWHCRCHSQRVYGTVESSSSQVREGYLRGIPLPTFVIPSALARDSNMIWKREEK